jgi:hypothetical protein
VPTPNQQAFDAVLNGTSEQVRQALAAGANPSAFRGTKCLLVRALEDADPEQAVAKARLLLEAGANWNPAGAYTPVRQIFSRRLADLLPVLAAIPGALSAPVGTTDYFPAGWAAQDQWGEGLRLLKALGVDVRYSQSIPVRNPNFTSTLETWIAFSAYRLPTDLHAWLDTAQWLLEQPLHPADMPRAREGVLNALERLRWKKAPHTEDVEALIQRHSAWMNSTAARLLANQHLEQLFKAKTMADNQRLWDRVVALVHTHAIPLSPGDEDHAFKHPFLKVLLKLAAQHANQPKHLKATIAKIEWALQNGATIEDHHRGAPVWYLGFKSNAPWEAMVPLFQRGLDPRQPPAFSFPEYLIDTERRSLEAQQGSTALELLLHSSREAFENLAVHLPDQLERPNGKGQTLLLQLAQRDFKTARGDLDDPWHGLMFFEGQGADLYAQDPQGNHFLLLLTKNRTVQPAHLARVVYHVQATHEVLFDLPNQAGETPRQVLHERFQYVQAFHPWFASQALEQSLPQACVEAPRKRF